MGEYYLISFLFSFEELLLPDDMTSKKHHHKVLNLNTNGNERLLSLSIGWSDWSWFSTGSKMDSTGLVPNFSI